MKELRIMLECKDCRFIINTPVEDISNHYDRFMEHYNTFQHKKYSLRIENIDVY